MIPLPPHFVPLIAGFALGVACGGIAMYWYAVWCAERSRGAR